MAEQPKGGFYVAVAIVILALIGFAIYRSDLVAPKPAAPAAGGEPAGGKIDLKEVTQAAESTQDTASPTTVKEYRFKPAEKLPPVKGIAAYKPLVDNTVRFALNVWAGWAPIVLANNGFKAGQEWTAGDGSKFKVELVLIDNPVAMRDSYASGAVAIGWATLDMVPLFLETFVDAEGNPRDSRIMPRVYQQVDFSNGGDGIVVRENIKTAADLRGKNRRASAEFPVALLFPQHAGLRRRTAARSPAGLHRRCLPGGGRVQLAQGTLSVRLLGARHLQPVEDQGQPPARDDPGSQPADRRRLVRSR